MVLCIMYACVNGGGISLNTQCLPQHLQRKASRSWGTASDLWSLSPKPFKRRLETKGKSHRARVKFSFCFLFSNKISGGGVLQGPGSKCLGSQQNISCSELMLLGPGALFVDWWEPHQWHMILSFLCCRHLVPFCLDKPKISFSPACAFVLGWFAWYMERGATRLGCMKSYLNSHHPMLRGKSKMSPPPQWHGL